MIFSGLGTHGLTADASGSLISLHVALKNELQRHVEVYKQALHKLEELVRLCYRLSFNNRF